MHQEGHEKQPSESELHFQVRCSVFKTHNGCLRWGPSPRPLWPALGATWSRSSRYAWSESSWQPCRDCQSNAKGFWVDWGHIQSLPNWLHHIDVWLRQPQWHQLWGCSEKEKRQKSLSTSHCSPCSKHAVPHDKGCTGGCNFKHHTILYITEF